MTSGLVHRDDVPTAVYSAIHGPDGELVQSVGQWSIMDKLTTTDIDRHISALTAASFVVSDANASEAVLGYVCQRCAEANVPVWLEPTSVEKAVKAMGLLSMLHTISPNLSELEAMHKALPSRPGQWRTAAKGSLSSVTLDNQGDGELHGASDVVLRAADCSFDLMAQGELPQSP